MSRVTHRRPQQSLQSAIEEVSSLRSFLMPPATARRRSSFFMRSRCGIFWRKRTCLIDLMCWNSKCKFTCWVASCCLKTNERQCGNARSKSSKSAQKYDLPSNLCTSSGRRSASGSVEGVDFAGDAAFLRCVFPVLQNHICSPLNTPQAGTSPGTCELQCPCDIWHFTPA